MRSDKFFPFEIPDPDLPIHYITFWRYDKDKWSKWQNSVWPCVKDHAVLCACAKSRHPGKIAVNLLPSSFSATTISGIGLSVQILAI